MPNQFVDNKNTVEESYQAPLTKEQEEIARLEQMAINQALIDMSAYIVPRGLARGVKSLPVVGTAIKKHIPDPKVWNNTRKAKNKMFNTATYSGSAAAAGSGLVEHLTSK